MTSNIRFLQSQYLQACQSGACVRFSLSMSAADSIRQRSNGNATAMSQQAEGKAIPAPGRLNNSTPASPMFTYQTFPQPLQDTSNLPSAHTQRAAAALQHSPSQAAPGQGQWQPAQPSRSSSDCFSMDPAQLEADIAALTSAIAADAAGVDAASEDRSDCYGCQNIRIAAHADPGRLATQYHPEGSVHDSEMPVGGSDMQQTEEVHQHQVHRQAMHGIDDRAATPPSVELIWAQRGPSRQRCEEGAGLKQPTNLQYRWEPTNPLHGHCSDVQPNLHPGRSTLH